MATVIRTRFDVRKPREYAFTFKKPSLVQAQHQSDCDVDNILAKYRKTGMLTHINKHQGNFGDFTNVDEYNASLERVMQAQQSFDQLPSELRNKFGNDPAQLVQFISDPKNLDDCYKYGLKIKPPDKTPSIEESLTNALATNDAKRKTAKT